MAEPTDDLSRKSLFQRVFYAVCWVGALITLKLLFGLRRYGMRNLPKRGAVLLISNHQSYLDPPVIGLCLHRQFHPIAREGLFEAPRFAWLIRMLNAIPLREGGQADSAAMRQAIAALNAGEPVLVFPEGSRTENGEIGEFKRGVGLLLKRSACVVAPVAIDGAFEAWPRSRKRPKPFSRIGVMIGEPIPHDELLADGVDAALERLRTEVVQLRRDLRGKLKLPPLETRT